MKNHDDEFLFNLSSAAPFRMQPYYVKVFQIKVKRIRHSLAKESTEDGLFIEYYSSVGLCIRGLIHFIYPPLYLPLHSCIVVKLFVVGGGGSGGGGGGGHSPIS